MIEQRMRWESESRWYEAHLGQDLFGSWMVVRYWGSKHNALGGTTTTVTADRSTALAILEDLDRARRKRKPAYLLVNIASG